jgi:molecular chaperone DnaK
MAAQNKLLGRFDLSDIPPAPRGMPQIEVTFDIDANGILNVSAKDKGTGKAQSIQIKANSGLSDEEIQQMVRDAEANAEEDKKFVELAAARNEADGVIHSMQKTIKEQGDKVSADEKKAIDDAIDALEIAAKENDVDDIKAKLDALQAAAMPVLQRMYAEQPQEGADGQPQQQAPADDGVVDAEFTEVKDAK